jgi:hypothetical protein
MALEFVDDFPHIVPDPPQAHVQFSVEWKGRRRRVMKSRPAGVRVDLDDDTGTLLAAIVRNVVPLAPGETDQDTVGVGAVGSGAGVGVRAVVPGI